MYEERAVRIPSCQNPVCEFHRVLDRLGAGRCADRFYQRMWEAIISDNYDDVNEVVALWELTTHGE